MESKIKFLKGIIFIEVVMLLLFLWVCLSCSSDIPNPGNPMIIDESVSAPISCGYQSFGEHCFLNYDSTKFNWRYSGFDCDYWDLDPAHVNISWNDEADYVIVEEVPFRMTINYEIRELPSEKLIKIGCQTICPESRVIIIPKGGIEGRYETIIHTFCGRIVLFGGTVPEEKNH
ncbi:MAG: hypothetical protein R8N23_05460 [Reichenbachiella sp.]|uniref:hypothetical protein n=1 Tax=Reichenbachiella sp. TaxID=2184521 RepID=UPI002965D3EA|nr:hypothetical protein [Reichenbachiella sp.]MDW3209291.1 hypothetical protein [Reichenbachiella sp.]